MNSILEALYNGRLRPDEMMMPTHPEYQVLGRQIAILTEQWKNRLSDNEFLELEQLFDLWGDVRACILKLRLYKVFVWAPICLLKS